MQVSRLESEFSDIPAARELVVNVRERIEEFRSKMPVIRTLGNPGFRDRHWENVSNTVGFPVKGGSNLFQILDMGLDEYVSKFEKISEAATKEFNLEKSMQQMVDDWADMEFNIAPYGDTGTYTLSSMDSIQVRPQKAPPCSQKVSQVLLSCRCSWMTTLSRLRP